MQKQSDLSMTGKEIAAEIHLQVSVRPLVEKMFTSLKRMTLCRNITYVHVSSLAFKFTWRVYD